jgi:hypothetical protein
MRRSKLGGDEFELVPREDLHLASSGRRVRNNRSQVLLDVFATDAVPENLTERAMDVMS